SYDEEDLVLVEVLGRRAALALENARLFSETQDAETRYRTLVESVDAVLWSVDAATLEYTFLNRRAETLLGYREEQWTDGGFWRDIVHPDDRDRVLAAYRTAAGTGTAHDIEYRVFAESGQVL